MNVFKLTIIFGISAIAGLFLANPAEAASVPDPSWATGAADFEIWAGATANDNAVLTWDNGTLVCSATLSDDNASTVSCTSGTVNPSQTYRVQTVLKNASTKADHLMQGVGDYVRHRYTVGASYWAGASPTIGSCGFYDINSDNNGTPVCSTANSASDYVDMYNSAAAGNEVVIVQSTPGMEGLMYLITTASTVNTDSSSYMYAEIDAQNEDSSKITITKSPIAYSQEDFRVFANQASTSPDMPLAASNTTANLSSTGQAFRVRMLIKVTGSDLSPGVQAFTLQYAKKGSGSCADPEEAYADVGAATAISWYDNTGISDGDLLTATTTDPNPGGVIVNQTYEEANNFISTSTISAGNYGKWDFSLYDNGSAASTTYCFKAVKSGGTSLNAYNKYPSITTYRPASIVSAANQTFTVNQATSSISAITITAMDANQITADNDIRITIATASIGMIWDYDDQEAVITGDDSGKVGTGVTYADNNATLIIDVTSDFGAGDTITISDLSFAQFSSVTGGVNALKLYLDGGTSVESTDTKTKAITGGLAAGEHTLGQTTNQWSSDYTSTTSIHYRYSLVPSGENMTLGTTTFGLVNISGVSASDITNAKLSIDLGSIELIQDYAAVNISGSSGSITFTTSTTYTLTADSDFIIELTASNLAICDQMTIDWSGASTTGVTSEWTIEPTGDPSSLRHYIGSSLTVSNHTLGQVSNQWTNGVTGTTSVHYRYSLAPPAGESISLNDTTIDLSSILGVIQSDITDVKLYVDLDGDGIVVSSVSGQKLASTTFQLSNADDISVAMVDADSVVIAYSHNSDGGRGKIAVRNISDGSEELSPVTFSSGSISYISVAMVDADSVLIAFSDYDDSYKGKMTVRNVLTGAEELASTTFETGATYYISVAMVDADSVVIAYQYNIGKFVVRNVLTGAAELTATTFESGTTNEISAVMADSNSVVIAYRDNGDASKGKFAVRNVFTGSEERAPTSFDTVYADYISAAMADTNTIVIAYRNGDMHGRFTTRNILTGAEELASTPFDTGNPQFISMAMADDDTAVISYGNTTYGKFAVRNILTGAEELATTTFTTNNTQDISAVMADANTVVVAYSDWSATYKGLFTAYNINPFIGSGDVLVSDTAGSITFATSSTYSISTTTDFVLELTVANLGSSTGGATTPPFLFEGDLVMEGNISFEGVYYESSAADTMTMDLGSITSDSCELTVSGDASSVTHTKTD